MKRILTALLFITGAGVAAAQTEDSLFIKRISDYILTQGKSYDDLRYLTKQIGARLSGSPGMYKAEAWG